MVNIKSKVLNQSESKVYLNDIITPLQIKEWIINRLKVGIHTTVGSGKSTLINHNLSSVLNELGLNGLFVSNRTLITKQQELNHINNNGGLFGMEYKTTQSVIYQYKHKNILPKTDILIIDEYHQLITDSAFNGDIHLFNDMISKLDIPIIFMSATPPKDIFKLDITITNEDLNINTHQYNNVKIYHYTDEIIQVLDDVLNNTNDKVLFYINNSNKIKDLHTKYKDISMVYSSKSNHRLSEYIDHDKVDKLLKNQRFDDRILFTTKVIDSGVNIIDKDLKHIIVFSYDVEEVLQVIGRKRNDKDNLNVYLKNYNPKELGGLKSNVKYKLNLLDEFRSNPLSTIRSLQGTNEEYLIHELFTLDDTLTMVINTTVEENLQREYELLDDISKNSFIRELEKVNIYGEDITYKKDWNELEDYLRNHYENGTVWLSRKDRDPLIEAINYREDGKLRKSIGKLNGFLEKRKSNYRIEQFSTEKNIDGKRKQYRSAWKIIKL